jgi:DNA-binding MarR family transcriptional regulator
MRHDEMVKALEGDKGNISQSRRPLESKGWIVIDRTSSGRAAYLALTPEGLEKAAAIGGRVPPSCG